MGGFDIRRILHGEQEFELLKPIFVGDTLTGVRWASPDERSRAEKITPILKEAGHVGKKEFKIKRLL